MRAGGATPVGTVSARTASGRGSAEHAAGARPDDPLADRLADALRALEVDPYGAEATLVVAFSGGLDSCVLLHLLRFSMRPGARLVAAHFDHAMRPGSAADASWARGVCAAWDVAYVSERSGSAPGAEEAARDARYDFLERVRRRFAPARVLTAHHADDQAETVLFRILRGTGIGGLRGMPGTREPGIVRPLLGFWREELEAHAAAVGLRWREDPTNEQLGYARNTLRHEILPVAEARVSAGARRALVRLAAVAEREEEAWAEVLPDVLAELGVASGAARGAGLSLDRDATAALGPALRARVLRWAASRCGGTLDEAATARAVTFATAGQSGTRVELGGGLELRRELDRLELTGPEAPSPDEALVIERPDEGWGRAIVGGRAIGVRWCPWRSGPHVRRTEAGMGTTEAEEASFAVEDLAFPLTVRGRRPGDRISLPGGTSKLKKVLLAARVPAGLRATLPVVVDASGRVLWVPGVARAVAPGKTDDVAEEPMMTIRIEP